MQDFTQDRLIQSEKLTEFNIAYPIYITGWEVRQVQDINKLYARVFYKKLISNAKAAKVKLTCRSEFGEIIQEEIKSINDIDKKPYDFFEIYPLHNDTRKIEICVTQGVCSNGESVTDVPSVIVSNTFVPFNREIEYAAGQKLIASAKGYPQENESCWICCCGAINAKDSERCVVCKFSKTTVFEKITEENIKEKASAISDERKAKKEQEAQEQEAQRIKRKKRNKLIAILSGCCAIAIILFCSLYFPLAPLETVEQDGMEFTKASEYYVVTDYTGNDTTVTIPAEVRGVQVTEIGCGAFGGCKYIEKIEIPASITYIGDRAFVGCSQLTSIQLPDSLMDIGQSAFLNCEKLTDLLIPSDVQSIGLSALEGCTNLKTLSLPIIEGGWSGWSESTHLGYIFGQENIYDENCVPDSLTSVTITKADIIPNNLFDDCKSISNIIIPDNVTEIGASAFSGCNSLQEIDIPSNVTTIGNSAFSMCDALTEIKLSNNVSSIGAYIFDGCDNLTNVILPTSLTSISDYMFRDCSNLKSIKIPNGVTEIGESAFDGCEKLENINIPTGVTSIGESAFSNCAKLTDITIPKNVKILNEDTFYNCINLEKIILEEGLEEIKTSVFTNCEALTEIVIPNSVQTIESRAFNNCDNLQNISIPFVGESRDPDKNANGVLGYIFGYVRLGDKNFVTQKTGYYSSEDYCIPKSLRSIKITDADEINYGAFSNCSFLTSVIINEGVRRIDENAFLNCGGLSSFILPKSLTYIGGFSSSSNINKFYFSGSIEEWCHISKSEMPKYELYIENRLMEDVILDNTVTEIASGAFYNCISIKSIVLSSSVTYIRMEAFLGCTNVQTIFIPKSVANVEWRIFSGWKSSQTINCEAQYQPNSWGWGSTSDKNSWKYHCQAQFVWGYTGG